MEAEISAQRRRPAGDRERLLGDQRGDNAKSIINAAGSREQGVLLTKVSAFVFDQSISLERVESTTASLQSGHWHSRTPASMRRGAAGRA